MNTPQNIDDVNSQNNVLTIDSAKKRAIWAADEWFATYYGSKQRDVECIFLFNTEENGVHYDVYECYVDKSSSDRLYIKASYEPTPPGGSRLRSAGGGIHRHK